MNRIGKLTKEQESRFGEFRDKWTAIGLDTTPADRPRAEAAIRKCYECGGQKPPKVIKWYGSPFAMFRENKAYASDCIYGQHDSGWLGFYDYIREVLGLVTQTEPLAGLFELAKSAGWALPYEDICYVSERPTVLKRDDRGRLHSLQGPALQYPDGEGLYMVHGVSVPSDIIERPDKISVNSILAEANAEIRRVMLDIFGWKRFLLEGEARLVHKDEFGELYVREMPNDEPLVCVKVKNSTPEPDGSYKDYILRVAPGTKTAKEGVASTFRVDVADYNPAVET